MALWNKKTPPANAEGSLGLSPPNGRAGPSALDGMIAPPDLPAVEEPEAAAVPKVVAPGPNGLTPISGSGLPDVTDPFGTPRKRAPEAGGPSAAALTAEQRTEAAAASKMLMAGFGEIVSVLMRAEAYRARPLAMLEELAVPAVMSGQFSLAQAQAANGLAIPVGVVFWARVSPEVDQRLTAAITEPLRLPSLADWRSGAQTWILDAVGDHKVVEAMLSRLLDTEWHGQEVRMRARIADGSWRVGVLGHGKGPG